MTKKTKPAYQNLEDEISALKRENQILRSSKDSNKISDAQYEVITSNIGNVIAIIGIDGTIKYKSPSIEKYFGWKPEELIGKDGWQTVHPDDLERIQKDFFTLLEKDNASTTVEYRYKCKDGSFKWIELTAVNCIHTVINGVLLNYHDITERKLVENELKISVDKNKNLIATMMNAFALHEMIFNEKGEPTDYKFLEVNPAWERIVGIKPEMVIGKTIREIMPDIEDTWIHLYGRVVKTGIPEEFEDYNNATQKYYHVYAYRPSLGKFAVFFNDITERKQTEEKFRENEDKFSKAFHSNPSVMAITRLKDGRIVDVNESFLRTLGYSREELIDSSTVNLGLWAKSEERKRFTEAIQKHEHCHNKETQVRAKSGEIFEMLISGEIININNVSHLITIASDITERKKAEVELKLHSEIMKNVSEGIYLIGVNDGKIRYANPKFEKMFGYDPGEMIGQDVSIVNAPTEKTPKDTKEEIIDVLLRTGEWNGEVKNIKKDGVHFWCYANVSLFDHHTYGRVIVSVHTDITERKKAEQELVKAKEEAEGNEEKFRTLFDKAIDGILIIDMKGNIINANESLANIRGYTVDEIKRMSIQQLDTPEDAKKINQRLGALLKGEVLHFESKNYHKNGSIITTDVAANKIILNKKEYIIAFHRDLSEIKKVQAELIKAKEKAEEGKKALKHSHDLMKYIIEHNRSAVAVHDKYFKYIYVSQRYLQDYKIEEKEIIGKHHYDIFPDLPQKWRDVHKKALLGEVSSADDDPYFKDDGTVEWTRWECRPWYETDGTIGGFIVYTEVITQRKKMELALNAAKEKAEESDKLKSAFLANMSHEIRTPMNAILGFSSLLKKDNLSTEKKEKYLELIESGGNRLLNIISDIVDISKIDSNQLSINYESCNINELIDNLQNQFIIHHSNKVGQIKSTKGLTDTESVILTDETRLTQIISNLLENSLKFTKKGFVEFGYSCNNQMIQFYVKDTGIGIDPKNHKTIFERFKQVDNDYSKSGSGTGLGLAIVQSLTTLLGGEVWVESELENLPVGKAGGSTFYFTIPYQPSEIKMSDIEDRNIEAFKDDKVSILIAEDEYSNFMYLEALLEGYQYNIIHAKNGREAVEIIDNNSSIDLVLLDIKMPVMSGLQATKEIRNINRNIPIIAQTAYAMAGDKQKALKAGCNDYLAKPISEEKLAEIIRKYIKKNN